MTDKPPVRVFISYSHDSDQHRDRVLALAQRMRLEGIDAWIDRFEPHPPQGWERWMRERVDWADFVLLICTETYRRRYEGREPLGKGDGGCFEGLLLREELYEQHGKTGWLIPVVFGADDAEHRPSGLRSHTYYSLDTGYDDLYFRITAQSDPRTSPAPLGAVRSRDVALPAATPYWTDLPTPATSDDVDRYPPVIRSALGLLRSTRDAWSDWYAPDEHDGFAASEATALRSVAERLRQLEILEEDVELPEKLLRRRRLVLCFLRGSLRRWFDITDRELPPI